MPESEVIHTGERGVCGQRQELNVKYITFLCSSQHTVWQKPVMEMGQCLLMQAVTKDIVCSKDKEKAMWWVYQNECVSTTEQDT